MWRHRAAAAKSQHELPNIHAGFDIRGSSLRTTQHWTDGHIKQVISSLLLSNEWM